MSDWTAPDNVVATSFTTSAHHANEMSAVGSDDDYGFDLDYDSALEETLRTVETQQQDSGIADIEEAAAALALSPFDEFRRRNWLSVSDLVGTVWCEVQFDYRLRTQPWLQPQDRPAVITSTKGGIIPVDKGKVEDKEKILRRGETIHKRLEREIHPVEIKVSWVTEEDKWGLRLLNMLAGMEALLTLNKCRELPVVGFVDDILVFGIIDEITREPVEKTSSKAETRLKRSAVSHQSTLNDFFGGARPRTHRLFVSDSKTRAGGSMPREEDTTAGRLQCMLYKELLDALLVTRYPTTEPEPAKEEPASCHTACAEETTSTQAHDTAVQDVEHADNPSPAGRYAASDDFLSVLPTGSLHGSGWWRVFDHLGLEVNTPFTERFIAESRPVVVGNDLRFGADTGRTLSDYARVWDSYVAALGLGTHSEHAPHDGITEDNLELVFRRASGKRKEKKSSRKRRKGRSDQSKSTRKTEAHASVQDDKAREDGELQRAIELSLLSSQPAQPEKGNVAKLGQESETDTQSQPSNHQSHSFANRDEEGDIEYAGTACSAPPGWWGEIPSPPPQTSAMPVGFVETGADQGVPAEAAVQPSTPPRNHIGLIDDSPASFFTANDHFDSSMAEPLEEHGDTALNSQVASSRQEKADSDSEQDREAADRAWAAEMTLSQETEPPTEARVLHADTPSARRSRSPSPSPASGSIIGRHAFRHDKKRLAEHLTSVLAYWMGEREPEGVKPHDVRKCGWCEFEEGCEWREMKAREALEAYRAARSGTTV